MGGQEDNGQADASLAKTFLNLKPVQFRHLQVEHQAAALAGLIRVQEFLAGAEDLHRQIRLLDEPAQGPAGAEIVVHNKDGSSASHGLILPGGGQGEVKSAATLPVDGCP